MAILTRVAPIFVVSDMPASVAYYGRLGFATREYGSGEYGYAIRDGIEIHLGLPSRADPRARASAYLWVDDADELAEEWLSVGADLHMPEDTKWGQREGALVDPDGNVIRFGSPVMRSTN